MISDINTNGIANTRRATPILSDHMKSGPFQVSGKCVNIHATPRIANAIITNAAPARSISPIVAPFIAFKIIA